MYYIVWIKLKLIILIEKYDNSIIVDKVIDGSDTVISSKKTHSSKRTHSTKVVDGSEIFMNGKIVDDFNVLDKNYVCTLNVSATQQLHKIIMEQKNEINDLKTTISKIRGNN